MERSSVSYSSTAIMSSEEKYKMVSSSHDLFIQMMKNLQKVRVFINLLFYNCFKHQISKFIN